MLQDDEFDVVSASSERVEALGFKPQREIYANWLLPYTAELDEESISFLEQVKTNFGKAVMLREMKPACGVWSSRLMKYIRIYGLKFSKEDHIALIKLAFELVLIPDLEPSKLHKFATMFLMLTKKRHLISPEELSLPWRPLYEMGKKIFDSSATQIGMYHYLSLGTQKSEKPSTLDIVRKFLSGSGVEDALHLLGMAEADHAELPTSMEASYISMVKCARPYFPIEATKEILSEFLPQICPWANDAQILTHLAVFLPVDMPPSHAAHSHQLWFDELMQLWDTCYNSQCGISDLMTIFAGLAKHSPGVIDWSPLVPKMFMRFLHALNLPVSYKDMQCSKNYSLFTKHIAAWTVWAICPDGVVLSHLRSFVGAVESYLHSANAGRWSYRLRDLLRKLAREFLVRVRRERENRFRSGWENQTPDHYKLRDEDITEFVKTILDPTLQAVYSRSSGSLDISLTLHNLATLRPAIVIPPLIEKLQTSLTSLTEPHRVTAAMSAVAAVARPMLRGPDAGYPAGPTHVVPLLISVLPGLDPNDIKKTLVTLHFILVFSWMVPYIDCSSAHNHWSDLTEEELLTCESTAQLEDFVLVFLDKIFTIIESSVLENVRLDTKETEMGRSKTDAVVETALSSAATSVLMQCSPKIFKEALRKFKSFATESTFETSVSGSMIGVLLRVFARVDSEATLAAFVPKLCEELTELLSSDEALREENPPRDLLYRLVLLMHVVECDGTVLLKYMPLITPVLDRALKLHASYALTRSCSLLSHILTSLCVLDLKEWKSCPKDYGKAPEKWLPIREWGRGCLLRQTYFKWHVPSAEEAECAQMLMDRYLKHEVTRLRQWLNDERPMSRERRLRCFHIISASLSCGTFLPQPNEQPVLFMDSLVPPTDIPFITGVKYNVTIDGENVRAALTRLLCDIQTRLLEERSDDTRGLEMLIQVWERVIVLKTVRNNACIETRMRSYSVLERALDGHGSAAKDLGSGARLRMLLADAGRLQDDARYDLVCDAGITPSALKALHALYDLSVHIYTSVRLLAQVRLYWMLTRYPYSYRALVPRFVELLANVGEGDEWHARHKGVLFILLGPRMGPLVAKQDWETIRTLWPAILNAKISEKLSIMRLEQALGDTLQRQLPAINTALTVTDAVVDSAKELLDKSQLDDPRFVKLLEGAKQRELTTSQRTESLYLELIEELVAVAEAPGVQWRRLELVMQMLTACPSVQTRYPPNAVRFIVRSVIHDNITVRRSAQRLTHYALKQRKPPIKKIYVDPYEVAGVARPEKRIPGYRPDLDWAMWADGDGPQTDEEWDRPWLRNQEIGFYSWPERLKVAAPLAQQQLAIDADPADMEDGERHLYEFFSDEHNVQKMVNFFTVEEKKGKDKFNGIRFNVFKMAFAHFGERAAEGLMVAALRCAGEPLEAPQRFAAEVAAAALRAPRYWPRDRALGLQRRAVDVVRAGLAAVIPETMEDWGTCLATGVEKLDPRRGAGPLRALVELCAPPAPSAAGRAPPTDTAASFAVCARLYALQGALGSLSWRAAPLAALLLRRLDAAGFTHHPYQNVRETVGSVLMTVFDVELAFPGGTAGPAPRLADFLDSVRPRIAALYDRNGDIVVKMSASTAPVGCGSRPESPSPSPEPLDAPLAGPPVTVDVARLPAGVLGPEGAGAEREEAGPLCERAGRQLAGRLHSALRLGGDGPAGSAVGAQGHARAVSLLTTVLRGCMGVIVRGVNAGTAAQYSLLGAACGLAARGPAQPHDELPRAADGFLASLARHHHDGPQFDTALDMLLELAGGRSWWARMACVDFAQTLFFYGLPMLCERPERAVRAEAFALRLMRDSRLEVRTAAAKLLTGLMHCRALPDEERTLRLLTAHCRAEDVVERHFGVLGLCAYLSSRPYGLGPRLGDVLAELARHTSAPDPIPATLRAALADFRRTHHDDWPKHRERLTEEELDLLADLTAPPSYCA